MDTQKLERYLDSFGKYVVQQSRSNLTKGKKNVNKDLYNSIKFEVVSTAEGLSIKFYMANYGAFVDKGVSGNKKKQSYRNWEGKKVSSPFKYGAKQPPSGIIEKWISKKGLKGRVDKKWKSAGNRGGQFISNKSFAFLIARSIKLKGIKSLSFFQRPLELGLEKLGEGYLKSLKEDIIKGLTEIK
tara:strand:+ start:432 stop:986 length:555 start_codon:yes stop_codon:yes gene_type:complete